MGTLKIGTYKDRATQVGISQISTAQVGSAQIGAGQVGSTQHAPFQVDVVPVAVGSLQIA